jgi:hypothetical protein
VLAFDRDFVEAWLRREAGEHAGLSCRLEEDLPGVILALDRLAERMSVRQRSDEAAFQAWLLLPATQDGLRTLLVHLSEGRRLLLLAWLAEVSGSDRHTVIAALMEGTASPAGLGSLLRETVRRFHRRAELGRILSEARVARVLAVCAGEAA